jgi:hypothetical protein
VHGGRTTKAYLKEHQHPPPFSPRLLRPTLRVASCSPAPLSPSSGGSAGRSDWEREARPPCKDGSLGFRVFLRFGVVSPGGALSMFASGVGGKPGGSRWRHGHGAPSCSSWRRCSISSRLGRFKIWILDPWWLPPRFLFKV